MLCLFWEQLCCWKSSSLDVLHETGLVMWFSGMKTFHVSHFKWFIKMNDGKSSRDTSFFHLNVHRIISRAWILSQTLSFRSFVCLTCAPEAIIIIIATMHEEPTVCLSQIVSIQWFRFEMLLLQINAIPVFNCNNKTHTCVMRHRCNLSLERILFNYPQTSSI